MRAIVTEAGLVPAEGSRPGRPLVAAAAGPDAALAALEAAGAEAVVMARSGGGAALPAVARLRGHAVVALPDDDQRAAWAVAVALLTPEDADLVRRLEGLASAAAGGQPPALRPAAALRLAGLAWRPCDRCAGGGLPGRPCGRCGAPVAEVSP